MYLNACGSEHTMGVGVALQILRENQGLSLLVFHGWVITESQLGPEYRVTLEELKGFLSVQVYFLQFQMGCILFLF